MLNTLHQQSQPSRVARIVCSLAGLACVGNAALADNLYSNASASPDVAALALSPTTGSGVPAPAGSFWSEVGDNALAANSVAGFALHTGGATALPYRVADDFAITGQQSWSIDGIKLYVFSPTYSGANPVSTASMNIWIGQPGAQGSTIAYANNAITATATATNIYRTFSTTIGPVITAPATTRRVWEVTIPFSGRLSPGTYWIDAQLTPSSPSLPLYVVPATLSDSRGLPAWNASQLAGSGWSPLVDQGKGTRPVSQAQDLAFIITGTPGNVCDSIDFNNDGSFFDPQDIEAFLSVYSEGPCIPGGATCNDIDFNNDGSFFDPQDIDSFLSVYSEGPCI